VRGLLAHGSTLSRFGASGKPRVVQHYAAGVIDCADFEPRVTGLKTRVAQIQERQKDAAETADARRELSLVTNPLEDFATKVRAGLNTLNWLGTRDIIRTLVGRIEIDGDDIEVAFRVPPPGGSAPLRPVPLTATPQQARLYRRSSSAPSPGSTAADDWPRIRSA
jgi:site-specific DNA recombinase